MEKLRREPSVGLDRCRRQPLLVLKMLLEADDKHIRRYEIDIGSLAHTASAQELQHLAHVISLATPRLCANGLMATPTAALIPLDVDFAEISQRRATLR